jgi:hypothetical protein
LTEANWKRILFYHKFGGVIEKGRDSVFWMIENEDLLGAEQPNKEDDIKMADQRKFTITLESQFIPTPTMVKNKLGTGYKVIAVELEREYPKDAISDVDSAVAAILYTGYRALARANHPDLGGNAEIMMVLNKAKKEIDDLLKSLRA